VELRRLQGRRQGAEVTPKATEDELIGWMRRVCEARHPGILFQPLPNNPDDLVELDSGWCDIGWAMYDEKLHYAVFVHFGRRVGRLIQ